MQRWSYLDWKRSFLWHSNIDGEAFQLSCRWGIQEYTESQREYAKVTRKLGINIRSWRYGFEVRSTWRLTAWGRRFSAASLRHRCLFFALSLAHFLLQYVINEINATLVGGTPNIIVPPFCSKPRTRFNLSLPAFNDIHESIALFFTNSSHERS